MKQASSLKPLNERQHNQHGLVSIVIAGRDSSKYLAETIESCLKQSVPCEVVYADDCSSDNSLEIAYKYINQGLKVIPCGYHSGVCATRNRGAEATTAPWIIFVDSDDKLPPYYVNTMLKDLMDNPETPFIYPSCQCFGTAETFWKNKPWSEYDKWEQNQVSTTAMWRRSVFMSAGGWIDFPTMWDYSLALRCSRYGTPTAGKAVLLYRQHDNSQSEQLNERFALTSIPYREQIRRHDASLGIGSVVSGRLPELFPRWISKLACSVRYAQVNKSIKDKPRLLLLLHTEAQKYVNFYATEAAKYSDTLTPELLFVRDLIDRSTEYARRHSVCNFLAKACQTIQDTLKTDNVWLVEDDIIVPLCGCHDLRCALTEGLNPPIGVTGCYYNRHPTLQNQLLGGWIKDNKHVEPTVHFSERQQLDFVGTGCLMFWPYRPGSPKVWEPYSNCAEPKVTAHDWAWSEKVKGNLVAVGTVDCLHHTTLEEYV